jgi:ribosomal protein L27
MSKAQTPICRVGTEFPAGTVVAINNDHVLIDTADGVKQFSFSQVERFCYEQRSLSQA